MALFDKKSSDKGGVAVADEGTLYAPAAAKNVIAVGATDDADLIASFSQTGLDQELTAPGVNNLASYLVGQGQETTLTVDSDDGRELEAVPLLFAGMTGRRGLTSDAVYVTVDVSGSASATAAPRRSTR